MMNQYTASIDTRVVNDLLTRSQEEIWPCDLHVGRPYRDTNGNYMADVVATYEADFPFLRELIKSINKIIQKEMI
jgi:hypothetical protein